MAEGVAREEVVRIAIGSQQYSLVLRDNDQEECIGVYHSSPARTVADTVAGPVSGFGLQALLVLIRWIFSARISGDTRGLRQRDS